MAYYAYYARLKSRDKAIYRRSDRIAAITLCAAGSLRPLVQQLETALATADRDKTERVLGALANGILADLGLGSVTVRLLAARPSHAWGELHGLYEPGQSGRRARITVWMRTARHKRVVAFRTLLRTLLHELCHHLDYALLNLEDSLHTAGFFKRESSLFRQLVTD
ncbi:MAG: hypothetical protein OXF98_04790 [Rhodospirillaceae bacterium]|nr:hypothetical protein [Rhodospirillaceae bacterium]